MSTQMKLKMLAAAALMATTGLASANLLTNGDFELGTIPAPRAIDGGTTLPVGATDVTGWTVITSTVDWLQTNTLSNNAMTAWQLDAQSGDRFLDLTGLNATAPYGGVQQTFATTPGTVYDVTFWLGSTNTSLLSNGTPSALVSVANTTITAAVSVADTLNKWEPKAFQFTASSATSTLSFVGASGFNYIGLDNVSVTAVPEPGTIALMLAGLAAVGSVAARRRPQR
jgi:hypothetical protein